MLLASFFIFSSYFSRCYLPRNLILSALLLLLVFDFLFHNALLFLSGEIFCDATKKRKKKKRKEKLRECSN